VPVDPASPFQRAEGEVATPEEGNKWVTVLARDKSPGDHDWFRGPGRVVLPPGPSKTNWVRIEEVFKNNVVDEEPLQTDGTFAIRTIPLRGKYLVKVISGGDVYPVRQITIGWSDKLWPIEIHANMQR